MVTGRIPGSGGGAELAAAELDRMKFRSKKAYDTAKETGALHQVREVEK